LLIIYKNSDHYKKEMDKLTSTNIVNIFEYLSELYVYFNIRKIMAPKKIQHYYG
jgi:hypothetical protein